MSYLPKRQGIKNLKNSCFINSVLQQLLTVSDTYEYFKSLNTETPGILSEFISFCKEYGSSKEVLKPENLIKLSFSLFPSSEPYTRQDAQEFFFLLTDTLNRELKQTGNDQNFLESKFQGKVKTIIKCKKIDSEKTMEENFIQLNLDISNIEYKYINSRRAPARKTCFFFSNKNVIYIDECLNKYFCNFEEEVQESCIVCQEKHCSQIVTFEEKPEYLIICLKRFAFAKGKMRKLKTEVKLIDKLFINNEIYDLVSVVQHIDSFGRKHYRVFCKDQNQWSECDDSTIKLVDINRVLSVEPYIAMYQKITPADKKINDPDPVKVQRFSSESNQIILSSKNSARSSKIIPHVPED